MLPDTRGTRCILLSRRDFAPDRPLPKKLFGEIKDQIRRVFYGLCRFGIVCPCFLLFIVRPIIIVRMKEHALKDPASALESKEAPRSPKILIVSTQFDPHVDFIIPELRKRNIPFMRFNTEDFPLKSGLTILFEGSFREANLTLPLQANTQAQEITAVWYRRPAAFEFPSEFSPAAHIFAEKETRATIAGLWQILNCLWVNHPERNRLAEIKINQLKVAAGIGLQIPKTIITNNPEDAKRFFRSCSSGVVVKTLSGGMITDDTNSGAIFTNLINNGSLLHISNVEFTPTLFQEYVLKDVELRITVVGKKIFAAEIHSQIREDTLHDWRRGDTLALPHKVHSLPKEIEEKCITLVKSFGLYFSAIDMILTPDGRYVFLEINPNGQWAWIEELTDMPISEALVDLLSQR